jgi:D-arginine dehydrogenase
MLHYALGDALVRALTLASRPFFDDPPEAFSGTPVGRKTPVLIHAREEELAALDALEADIAPFATLDRLDRTSVGALCPLLRLGDGGAVAGIADRNGIRLDPHALLQGFLKALRGGGGRLVTDARAASIARKEGTWTVKTERGDAFSAPILVNAAGAWADRVADMARVRGIGLEPKRRTIITFDAPAGTDLDHLPFTKTVGEELYFAPESGRLLASPMDEEPSAPCDAQPDEYEVALAAHRMEERTTVEVRAIHSRWAGLRSFTPDRHPAVGFAPDAEGFFWLAGQGGFGLQTSPAMATIAESLIAGTDWPVEEVGPEALAPGRF